MACCSSALIEEIASAKSFFSLRARDYPCYDQIAKNFANALIQQVNSCLALSLHDGPLVIHALKDSPYADADIKRITAAIDAKMMLLQSSKAPPDTDQFPWPTISKLEVLDKPKVEKKSIRMDADSVGIPLMPKHSKDGNPAPARYRWGKIFTNQDKKHFRFRALGDQTKYLKGQRYSSVWKSWGQRRTKHEAWDELIATIQAPKK